MDHNINVLLCLRDLGLPLGLANIADRPELVARGLVLELHQPLLPQRSHGVFWNLVLHGLELLERLPLVLFEGIRLALFLPLRDLLCPKLIFVRLDRWRGHNAVLHTNRAGKEE